MHPFSQAHQTMAQFVGVLALLISETPVLRFNVTRYASALQQAMKNIPENDTRFRMNAIFYIILIGKIVFLGTLRNAINEFEKATQDFQMRSKSLNIEKLVLVAVFKCTILFHLQCL